jgi:hypothetical protein
MVQPDEREYILRRLAGFEREVRPKEPPAGGDDPFQYSAGSLPVLLSAPHGAAHFRCGRYKAAEAWTTSLVRLLAERTGAHAMFATHRSDSDPNYDSSSPYKSRLAEIVVGERIGFVLDVHGMDDRHGYGIALGTMDGRSCRKQEREIEQLLQSAGYKRLPRQYTPGQVGPYVLADSYVKNPPPFTGGTVCQTVTRFVSQDLGVAAAQLELAIALRSLRDYPTPNGHRSEARLGPALVRTLHLGELLVARIAELVGGSLHIDGEEDGSGA